MSDDSTVYVPSTTTEERREQDLRPPGQKPGAADVDWRREQRPEGSSHLTHADAKGKMR